MQRMLLFLIAGITISWGVVGPLSAPAHATPAEQSMKTVIDLRGREATLPVPATRIVALRAALGQVCYMNLSHQVVGVENVEAKSSEWIGSIGRSYRLANPNLGKLPVIGTRNQPDAEKLMAVQPDVIFTASGDARFADNLQRKTGIPVLFVDNGDLANNRTRFYDSLKLIGSVCGAEKRAEAIIDKIDGAVADLARRTDGLAGTQQPSTYIGGMNFRVAHGLLGTGANYPPFLLLGANNVADELMRKRGIIKGRFSLDVEHLLAADPEVIFICESGLDLVRQDFYNPVISQLRAVKDGSLYGVLPHYYAASPDTVLAETYYMGSVLYPERFADINGATMADDWYRFFVGKPLYKEMAALFGGFKRIDLGEKSTNTVGKSHSTMKGKSPE